jgi:hypothetical protein
MQTTNKKGTMKAQTDLPATGRTRPRMTARINLRLPLGMMMALRQEAIRRQLDVADVAREIIRAHVTREIIGKAVKGETK